MGGTQALIKWGPHLMDQEVGEIFWLQFDILEKDKTSWMMILLKYEIEGYLKIVENFLCQLLFLSVGAKGLGLENEGSTWNLSSSDKRRWQNTIQYQVACQQILLQLFLSDVLSYIWGSSYLVAVGHKFFGILFSGLRRRRSSGSTNIKRCQLL